MQMYIYQQHHYPVPYDYYRTQIPMMNYYQQNQTINNLKKTRERSRDKDSRNHVKKHYTRSNSSNSGSSSDSHNYK